MKNQNKLNKRKPQQNDHKAPALTFKRTKAGKNYHKKLKRSKWKYSCKYLFTYKIDDLEVKNSNYNHKKVIIPKRKKKVFNYVLKGRKTKQWMTGLLN